MKVSKEASACYLNKYPAENEVVTVSLTLTANCLC